MYEQMMTSVKSGPMHHDSVLINYRVNANYIAINELMHVCIHVVCTLYTSVNSTAH